MNRVRISDWQKIKQQHGNYLHIRKGLAILCVFVMVLQFGNITAYAASIDGEKGTLKVSSDSSYLYFNYEGEWLNYLSDQIQVSTNGGDSLGALSAIALNQNNDGDSSSLTVRNAWSSSISGASGSVTNSDKKENYGYKNMKWNIQVPIAAYGEYSFSSMTFTWNGKSVTLPVTNGEITTETTEEAADKEMNHTTEQITEASAEENEEQTSSEAGEDKKEITEASTENNSQEETTESGNGNEAEISIKKDTSQDIPENKESGNGIVVSGGIQIDGLYDDWEDIPKTDITYDSNNTDCVHYGQMYTDGTNIYAHFQTNALYTNPMQIHLWYLTINGQQFALQIRPESNGSIDWGTQIPSSEGTHTNLKVFIGYGSNNECDSNVVFTIYDESHASDTPGDDIEFSFSMERLSELTGIPVDQMGTITLTNPNLGGEGVTIAGSSTGPVIGVVAAFILVAAFLRKRSHSKRKAL